jgi:hypothetical protein
MMNDWFLLLGDFFCISVQSIGWLWALGSGSGNEDQATADDI